MKLVALVVVVVVVLDVVVIAVAVDVDVVVVVAASSFVAGRPPTNSRQLDLVLPLSGYTSSGCFV